MLGTILIVIVVLMLVGALPRWGHSKSWGYGPSGGLGLVVVILLILLLLIVIIGYGGNDGDCSTYWGWLVSAPTDGSTGLSSFQIDAGHTEGAIWGGGNAPPVDAGGNVYVATGNGHGNLTSDPQYGDSVVKLNALASPLDWWAPPNWQSLDSSDADLGSSAPTLLPGGFVFQSGKDGNGYLLNGAALGNVSSAVAKASGVVVSSTVHDLVVGSGLAFEDLGEQRGGPAAAAEDRVGHDAVVAHGQQVQVVSRVRHAVLGPGQRVLDDLARAPVRPHPEPAELPELTRVGEPARVLGADRVGPGRVQPPVRRRSRASASPSWRP